MSPYTNTRNQSEQYPTTSPWTEPYQASSYADAYTEASMWAANEREAQQPTHDALSDIYNRGS
jgi:hypothetical protein